MQRLVNFTPYWFTRQTVTNGGDIPIVKNCNGIVAVNIGTILAFVNGFPINPPLVPGSNGESWTIGGNYGEVLSEDNLEIIFSGVAGGKLFISMKYYVSPNCC